MDDVILDTSKSIQEPKIAYHFSVVHFIWDDKHNQIRAKGVWKDNAGASLELEAEYFINDPDFTTIGNELIKTANVDKKSI